MTKPHKNDARQQIVVTPYAESDLLIQTMLDLMNETQKVAEQMVASRAKFPCKFI
ncbi:MAG: hypothetical protein R3E08_11875 [Thiotrichaceae bacterium]